VTGLLARFRIGVSIALALAFAAVICSFSPVRAQQIDLSQEMQLFNSLPPDQQQAILQRLGQGGGGLGGGLGGLSTGLGGQSGGLGGYNSSQSALLQQQMLQQQRRLQNQNQDQEEQNPLVPPVFRSGDTVLVDIALMNENANAGTAFNGQMTSQNLSQGYSNSQLPNVTANQLSQLTPQQQQLLQQQLGQQLSANNQRLQEQPQQPLEELQADEKKRLTDLVELIRAHNPYVLDSSGELQLPGIPSIALAGLTEDLATRRAQAEPAFAKLQMRLTRLPLRKSGQAALRPFGYDLFDNSTPIYPPTFNVPVPADYVIGPGDELDVQLFGSQNQILRLIVARDGHVRFPQLGPIEVGGQRYSEVKSELENRVARQMIGVRASVSMGETRTINVFVLGEAKYPGS